MPAFFVSVFWYFFCSIIKEGVVPFPRVFLPDGFSCNFQDFFVGDAFFVWEKEVDIEAADVCIYKGFGGVPGKTSKGAGGVVTDAGKRLKRFYVFGKFTFVILYDFFRRFFQVFCTAPVAQTLPGFQESFVVSFRERLGGREGF